MGQYGHAFDSLTLYSILNESNNLNNKQIEHVLKILDSEYLKDIKSIAEKQLNKFKELKKQSYGLDHPRFTNYYDKSQKKRSISTSYNLFI